MQTPKTNGFVSLFILALAVVGIILIISWAKPAGKIPTKPPTPAPAETVTPPLTISVLSPDSTKNLSLQIEQHNGTHTYTVSTTDVSGNHKRHLFTTAITESTQVTIPQNSWSPDGTYVFVEEHGPGSQRILVLKASGELFSNNEPYREAISLFSKNQTKYHITGATGWDSPTLLHITTTTDQSTRGPSFWFDVATQAFLQLR